MPKPRKKRDPTAGFDPAARDAVLGERRTMGELDELFRQMKKALMERALAGELTHHLGYAPGDAKPADQPKSPQRDDAQDGAHRRRRDPRRHSPRSGGDVRAPAHPQECAPPAAL